VRVYATAADYAGYSGAAPPSDIDRRLRRASELLDACLSIAIYDVDDTTGLPTDPTVIDVFARATCAQVAYWLETGDEQGSAQQWESVGIGSVQLQRSRRANLDSLPTSRLAPQAYAILQTAGLRLWVGQVDGW
jgi:hypothetical protein